MDLGSQMYYLHYARISKVWSNFICKLTQRFPCLTHNLTSRNYSKKWRTSFCIIYFVICDSVARVYRISGGIAWRPKELLVWGNLYSRKFLQFYKSIYYGYFITRFKLFRLVLLIMKIVWIKTQTIRRLLNMFNAMYEIHNGFFILMMRFTDIPQVIDF